jgi:hypothetical protein
MRVLHLLIADLFPPADFVAPARQSPAPPGLRAAIARGQSRPGPGDSFSAALGRLFGLGDSIGLAPYLLGADGMDPDAAVWMRLDPVHLQFQHDRLYLTEGSRLDLDMPTARALVDSLNTHFAGEGLECVAPHPQRWYVRLPRMPDMAAQPLDAVAGRRIDPRLPKGPDASRWTGFINEAQMLFHEHPANLAREAAGLPPINSVWPWGAGRWQRPPPVPWRIVFGSALPAMALGRAAGLQVAPPPAALNELPEGPGEFLLVSEQLSASARYGDPQAWRRDLAELDERWLRPALAALRRGRLDGLVLEGTGDEARALGLGRWQVWRFWRRG